MLKEKYKSIFASIRDIIIRYDPMDLIKAGAPVDEYDMEVGKILPRLKECLDVDDVNSVMIEIFRDCFNETNFPYMSNIAREVFEVYQTERNRF